MENTSFKDTEPFAEAFEGENGVTFSGLDPILGSLGEMVGLLDKESVEKDIYNLNNEWFKDPIENTKSGFTKKSAHFGDLLGQILGKVGGNALGVPIQDPALLGNWYPVKYDDKPTGLYFISHEIGTETVLGLGVLHSWTVTTENPLVKVNVWGQIPFLRIQDGEVNITFDKKGYPINFGVALEGAKEDSPLVDINDVSFNGVKVNASIDLAPGATPFEIAVQVLALKLTGDEKPSDRTLADLEAITGKQILETVSSLFVGALSKVFDDPIQQTRISYFPPLLGFTSIVPKSDEKLPVLEWYELFKIASSPPSQYPNGVATPFLRWFNTLSANPAQLKTWLSCLGGFISGTPVSATGSGTRNNPFQISLISMDRIGKLNFTVGTDVVSEGNRYFYPGISFAGKDIALGDSDVMFNVEADLEFARFQLSGNVPEINPTINFQFKCALNNKVAGQPLCKFDKYSFGNLEGGMSFGLSGSVVPYFRLNKVVTASSSYDTIDLLSPSQLANAGASLLSDGIKTLLGVTSEGTETFANNVASLIGLTSPQSAGTNWPKALPAPFDADQMINSITNPIGAWADYYLNILKYAPLIDNKTAFTYIVKDFAQMLNAATDTKTITVTGDGTQKSPWKAGITLPDITLPAYLTAYQISLDNKDTRLIIGLSLEPELTLLETKVVPSVNLDLISVDFPEDKNKAISADWLPLIAAKLTLPDGFKTPEAAGISVSVDESQLSGSWSRHTGWGWSLFVNNPSLLLDGKKLALGEDLNFDDKTALEDLVIKGVNTFGPFLVGALGAFLMRTNTRAGLLTTGAFGLLTDLSKSPIYPKGYKWEGFTQFKIKSFKEPWVDIRNQFADNFSTDDKAKSLLGLLSWTINSDLEEPPAINGSGTFLDPYKAPLPKGFEIPVWYDKGTKVIGTGIGRNDEYNYSNEDLGLKFRFDLETRLNAIEYSLATGGFVDTNNCPSFSLLGTLSNPDGLLIDLPLHAGSVGKVVLGLNLSIADSQIRFEPVVTMLNVTLAGQEKRDSLTLNEILDPDFAASLQQSFYVILNEAVQVAVAQVKDVPGFKTAYDLLTLLGLVIAWEEEKDTYGINVSGWNGLLANFDTYIEAQLSSLLTDVNQRKRLFAFLENIFDIKIPDFPQPLLDLLYGLEICGPAEQGYPLYPKALLEIFSNPVESIRTRFENLFSDTERLRDLTRALVKDLPPAQWGNFTFSTTTNGVVILSILPENAFKLGSFAEFSGSISLDLINMAMECTLNAYCPVLELALSNTISLRYPLRDISIDKIFSSKIIWGNGSMPSADPLPLFPFNGDDFVDKLSKIAPAYVLNVLLNAVLEDSLLNKYPFLQQVMKGLGLAKKTDSSSTELLAVSNGQEWSMQSLLGILKDPLPWLLSDDVLGHNGKFNIGALAKLLSNLPEVSTEIGIKVKPVTNGVNISGLPYGMGIDITGENGVASFMFGTKKIDIAEGMAVLDNLRVKVDLDANYQPAFSGAVDISTAKSPVPFFVSAGFDKQFLLKVTKGTPEKPDDLNLQLLPFLGWGNIAGQAAAMASVTLIDELLPMLLDKLEETSAKPFIQKMRSFAGDVEVQALTKALLKILTPDNFNNKTQAEILAMIEEAGLKWLKDRFNSDNADKTAGAVKTLLADVLPGQVTTEGGLVLFKPGENFPVIKAGVNNKNLLGLWANLDLPALKIIDISIDDTGAGIDIDTGKFDFNFGLNVMVPIEGTSGPSISLQYVSEKGFELMLDPLTDKSKTNPYSPLRRQLLPEFFPGPGTLPDRMREWIFSVFKNVVPRYISALVLNQESVHKWLEDPIISTGSGVPSPALLLEATSLIKSEGDKIKKYYLNSFDDLANITPQAFFGNLLKTLMEKEITLLSFGEDKKSTIKIGPDPGNPDNYGLHLFAPNLKIAAIPNIVLQLGDTDDAWIKDSGGTSGNPGIGIYLPIKVDDKTKEISADFSMINLIMDNVGFDIVGKEGRPIVDFKRFVIEAIKPRVLFDMKLNGGDPEITFGAAATLEDIGISLAPDSLAPQGGDSNPIASNLLGSGDEKSENNPATNPTFSVTAGYTSYASSKIYFNLKSDTGDGTRVILPVQRGFGPLFIDSLGLGWDGKSAEKYLDFIFSGSVELAGLKATLIGLDVGLPTAMPTNFKAYKVDLEGLDISFKGGSVSLDAGLLKQTEPFLCYNGTAVIKGGSFSLMALGSYAEIPVSDEEGAGTAPSLFVFGVLNMPLGGPPAFFVTGIAAGFSYNRSIQIPSIEEVQGFPLVKGVVDGSFTSSDPIQALTDISAIVKPEIGQYWVAAGLKFKSFELINTVALLFLSFGKEWEINLLGLSYATLPPEIPDVALAYFELAIKVSFKPEVGIISAEARLTPNSYVLSRDCKVTGGFAFYLWYKDITTKDYKISAGDFVITLGGYHPAFAKPVYYPDVPRLGMQWKMDISVGKISVGGGAYFALCPTAIMAGGYINVSFEMGSLSAWLNAYANFLIEWKPFYFNVGIGITVGVSFGTTIAGVSVTLKAELGAKLNLEGPPTHGSVEVNWYVISFTIPIGQGETAKDNQLTWDLFAKSFLPANSTDKKEQNGMMLKALANEETQEVVKWNAQSGLQSSNKDSAVWVVNPVPFSVSVQSAIPASQVTVGNSDYDVKGAPVGVRPMGYINDLDAPFTISLVDESGKEVNLKARNIKLTEVTNGAPSALWSKQMLNKEQAPNAKTMLIDGALFGLTINADKYVISGDIPAFNIANLTYDDNKTKLLPFALTPKYPAAALYPDQNRSYTIIKESIMKGDVITKRNDVFTALRASEMTAPANPDLSVMAFAADLILQDLPVIARVGIYQNGGQPEKGRPLAAKKGVKKPLAKKVSVVQPQLQGVLKRYVRRSVAPRLGATIDMLPLYNTGVTAKWSDKMEHVAKSAPRETPSPDFITIHDGGVALWKTDVNGTTTVKNDGSLPVLIFSFNEYGEITAMKYFETGATYTLPEFTAQVAIQGYEQDTNATVGWQKDTLLSKINPVWTLTDKALIRVQNSQRITIPGTGKQMGLMDAGYMLKNNMVQGVNGLEPGWIQSLFPISCKYIAIMTENSIEGDTDVKVSVVAGQIPLKTGLSTPLKTYVKDDKTILVYAVPKAKSTDTYYGVIAKPGSGDINIAGMYGLNSIKEISGHIWHNLSLGYGAIDLEADVNKSSTLKVTTK